MSAALLRSPATGTVWQRVARVGEPLAAGAVAAYVESMKMEIPVTLTQAGTIRVWLVNEGDAVEEGQPLAELG